MKLKVLDTTIVDYDLISKHTDLLYHFREIISQT